MNIKKVEEKSMTIHIKKSPEIHRKLEADTYSQGESDRSCDTAKSDAAGDSGHAEEEKHPGMRDTRRKAHPGKKSSMTHTLVKAAEAEAVRTAAKQTDGGEEVHDAALLAYEVSRPLSAVTRKGTDVIKASLLEQKRKKYKIVSPTVDKGDTLKQSNNLKANPTAYHAGVGTMPGEKMKADVDKGGTGAASKSKRHTIKIAPRQETKAAAKESGRASAGAYEELRYTEQKQEMRNRKMKSSREKQARGKKTAGKKVTEYLGSKIKQFTGKATAAVLGVLGGAVGLLAMVAIPVVLIVTVLYHSPFALFLPSLDPVDTVQSVTNALVSDFIMEVETLAKDHTGYDEGEIYYCDPDGNTVTEVPQKDIMCVYMVKYGVGDAASVMNDRGKRRLETVVEDMCVYTTTDRTEVRKDEKGKKYSVTILEVNVTLKDYQDMVDVYGFNQEKAVLLETLMNQW